MDSRYLTVLEKQLDWLQWSKSPQGDADWRTIDVKGSKGDSWKSFQGTRVNKSSVRARLSEVDLTRFERLNYEECLEKGAAFYVDEFFCELVEHARRTTPDSLAFDPSWMLSDVGFVWFETPFALPKIKVQESMEHTGNMGPAGTPATDFRLAVRAMGWRKLDRGDGIIVPIQDGGGKWAEQAITVESPTYQLLFMQEGVGARIRDAKGLPEVLLADPTNTPGFWPLANMVVQEGMTLGGRIEAFEQIAIVQGDESEYLPMPDEMWRHEARLAFTLLSLMSQKVTLHVDEFAPRFTRRRFSKAGYEEPDRVRVISLRRVKDYEIDPDREASGITRVYRHQWDVRGYWLEHPYYPNCDDCVAKKKSCGQHQPIWIKPFVKGPPGAPFKGDQRRLYVAQR